MDSRGRNRDHVIGRFQHLARTGHPTSWDRPAGACIRLCTHDKCPANPRVEKLQSSRASVPRTRAFSGRQKLAAAWLGVHQEMQLVCRPEEDPATLLTGYS